jgi:hypothetical protein
MSGFHLTLFFSNVLPTLLFISLFSIGLILAVVRRKRHPKVSLLAGIYFLVQIIRLTNWLAAIISIYYVNNGQGAMELMRPQSSTASVNLVISFILFVIMLYAIFGWREQVSDLVNEITTQ